MPSVFELLHTMSATCPADRPSASGARRQLMDIQRQMFPSLFAGTP